MHGQNDPLALALLDLARFISDTRRDRYLIAEAGLDLDPAFLPLLVRLGTYGPAGVVELADELGRDHSSMSRQVAKLEAVGLAERARAASDARLRIAKITQSGQAAVAALAAARKRALDQAIGNWTAADRETLGRLLGRFTSALQALTDRSRQDLSSDDEAGSG
ncbi:DNA-binding transcriptional regulator, MarR family [Kaistia soli DSM 19436]|uniref:DNA-binding transcriptional regulator, MarR family n=2 Tax=Kaistia TaxID=166953 RepID=A0A1M5A7N7_9HYPH|nr:DNA-binding transcriptional regulator, MarR family [Kaistia soli DSM 19436]